MGNVDAAAFATAWIEAWNSHEIEKILSHCADGIVFLSPLAQVRVGDGRVVGLPALRAYWTAGLKDQPNLKFELIDVFSGHGCLTIHYRNHRGQTVAETVEFDDAGKVARAYACYA